MNTQKEYGNDMDIDQVKDNNKTKPGETYEYKKERKYQKNQKHNIIIKESLQYYNIGLILNLTGFKTIL